MSRATRLSLVCLTVFLVAFPLVVGKPGLPMTLKADEPAYYLMALSLARDGDLACDTSDLARLFDEYPYLATFNLILMTDDGWHTVFFGKPYVYSLFAAPFAGLFGANGLVAFNMLLLMGMIWMGTAYLGRFNASPVAAVYAVGFFLLSSGFAYVFWLHPEIFNMACVMGSLFLILHEFDDAPPISVGDRWRAALFGPAMRPVWSAALLAMAVYNKPMLAAMGLPSIFVLWRRRRRGRVVAWLGAAVLAMALVALTSIALTGHASAYLGVERMGVPVFDAEQMPVQPVVRPPSGDGPTTNSWTWLARIPEVDVGELTTHIGYFLWGRHTGLLPYMPFAVLSVLLFLAFGRRSALRWLLLGSLASVAVFFLVWIPFNWHGGGGFVGNRYFVNVYPGFLFLVTWIRPTWIPAVAYAVGGLLLGPIVFTPFGAPVPEPTLQAHVRNASLRWLPLELTFRKKLPGYQGASMSGAWFFGRKDVLKIKRDEILVHGATPVEIWMVTAAPLADGAVFQIRNSAPENRIVVDLEGDRRVLDFAGPAARRTETLELFPTGDPRPLSEGKRTVYAYRMRIESRSGFIANAAANARNKNPINDFYQGAGLAFLGTQSDLDRDLYSADWGPCEIPATAAADEVFTITARVTNRSAEVWPAEGPTRVNLSYRWLDAEGRLVVPDGRRTGLPRNVPPGGAIEVEQSVTAPAEPGSYRLVTDLVRERVSWFSQKRLAATCEGLVTVSSPATGYSPEP